MHASCQERVKEAVTRNSLGRIKIKHFSVHDMFIEGHRPGPIVSTVNAVDAFFVHY